MKQMSQDNGFHVYLTGETVEGFDFGVSLDGLVTEFRLTTAQKEKLLQADMPYRIKRSVTLDKAKRLEKILNGLGLCSTIESDNKGNAASGDSDVVENSLRDNKLKELSPGYREPYRAPESSLTQSNTDISFGGWLRVFQVLTILPMIIGVFTLIAGFVLFVIDERSPKDTGVFLITLVETIPFVILNALILRVLTNTNDDIPRKIRSYLNLKFTAALVVYWALEFTYYSNVERSPEESLASLLGLVFTMIYCWGWIFYFKRSKRVSEYYTENRSVIFNGTDNPSGDKERKFKIPLATILSSLMVFSIFIVYWVIDAKGAIGSDAPLRSFFFPLFILSSIAIFIVVIVCKKQLDDYLKAHAAIETSDDLELLRKLAKTNSRLSIFMLVFMGLGALAAVGTISNEDGFSVYVAGSTACTMLLMTWYRPTEDKIKQLRCASPELEEELVSILNDWGNKVER